MVAMLSFFTDSAASFCLQSIPTEPRSSLNTSRNARFFMSSGGSLTYSNNDNEVQQEFDIDDMTTFDELNQLSTSIGGPFFTSENTSSIESAKNDLWEFVEGKAEDDVDKMCMGQLSGLMIELGGEDFADGITIDEARNVVWELASKLQNTGTGVCGCSHFASTRSK